MFAIYQKLCAAWLRDFPFRDTYKIFSVLGLKGFAVPARVIGQALGLSHRGKQFGVKELASEQAVG